MEKCEKKLKLANKLAHFTQSLMKILNLILSENFLNEENLILSKCIK